MNNLLNELLMGEFLVILLAVILLVAVWFGITLVVRRASYTRQNATAFMARLRLFWRRLT